MCRFSCKTSLKWHLNDSLQTTPAWPSLMSTRYTKYAHLLPLAPGQVLLGCKRADGADPRLGHAFNPQHHPAELLPL